MDGLVAKYLGRSRIQPKQKHGGNTCLVPKQIGLVPKRIGCVMDATEDTER